MLYIDLSALGTYDHVYSHKNGRIKQYKRWKQYVRQNIKTRYSYNWP